MRIRLRGRACLLLAAAGAAVAQTRSVPSPYDRDNLAPTPLSIYGRVSAGYTRPEPPRDPASAASASGINPIERNRLGIRGVEVLGSGWHAQLQLEHSLRIDTGQAASGSFWDARATVGVSERWFGRLDLGRIDQAAALLAQRADPWIGNGIASPDRRSYVVPDNGPPRTSGTVSWQSSEEYPLRGALQVGRPLPTKPGDHEHGGSLVWDRGRWLAGAGWQRWPDGSRTQPAVLVYDDGAWRLGSVYTVGRRELVDYRNLFVGAQIALMQRGDPQRHVFRIGLNRHRADALTPGGSDAGEKLGVGWQWNLSRHAWVTVNAARVRPCAGPARHAAEIGFTYSFERNLRLPQWLSNP